jgi:thioredoxin 1
MKKILMFVMGGCPYCAMAHRWTKELLKKHPEYSSVETQIVDELEQPEFADEFDYYYVPTYYVGGVKIHEGVPTRGIIESVYQKALRE